MILTITESSGGYRRRTEENAQRAAFDVLEYLCLFCDITHIRSGGQTGFDLAGLRAALKLNMNTIAHFPRGFTIRTVRGQDVNLNFEDVESYIRGNYE